MADLENLDHGLEDEDETDERGENIFGELGEVFHQARTLKNVSFLYQFLKFYSWTKWSCKLYLEGKLQLDPIP
jgi:hypothetical protein